jgi:hypothetical protein
MDIRQAWHGRPTDVFTTKELAQNSPQADFISAAFMHYSF